MRQSISGFPPGNLEHGAALGTEGGTDHHRGLRQSGRGGRHPPGRHLAGDPWRGGAGPAERPVPHHPGGRGRTPPAAAGRQHLRDLRGERRRGHRGGPGPGRSEGLQAELRVLFRAPDAQGLPEIALPEGRGHPPVLPLRPLHDPFQQRRGGAGPHRARAPEPHPRVGPRHGTGGPHPGGGQSPRGRHPPQARPPAGGRHRRPHPGGGGAGAQRWRHLATDPGRPLGPPPGGAGQRAEPLLRARGSHRPPGEPA